MNPTQLSRELREGQSSDLTRRWVVALSPDGNARLHRFGNARDPESVTAVRHLLGRDGSSAAAA